MKRGTIDHPKTHHLAHLLNVPHLYAVGFLEAFFHWACKYAADGELTKFHPIVISRALGHAGDGEDLLDALESAGWIDRLEDDRLLIHDWAEHCEESVHKALQRSGARFADGSAPFARRGAAESREAPGKGAPKKSRKRADDAPSSREQSDNGATPSRQRRACHSLGPGPMPLPQDPEESVSGLGLVGPREGPSPRPQPTEGRIDASRNALEPPDGFDPADWRRACHCADLIEQEGLWGNVDGVGGELRAKGLALFAEWWLGRPYCRDSKDPWPDIEGALEAAHHQPHNEDRPLIVALRKYPDSPYPATGQKGAPSRLERLIRNHQQRKSADNLRPPIKAGHFATPQPMI